MKTYIVVDLGFGDAGKGTTVDFLSRTTPDTLIVRYNGGPQAAHNVVTPDGKQHTFAQFGSGTLVPSVRTYLSKYMWVEPLSLWNENTGLHKLGVTDAISRLFVDRNAKIITPFHKVLNRIRAQQNKHGSCGVGMADAVVDSFSGLELTVGMLESPSQAISTLKTIQEKKLAEYRALGIEYAESEVLRDPKAPKLCYDIFWYILKSANIVEDMELKANQLIFEGACGVLLDQDYGFHPHTMWSTTTTKHAREMWDGDATTLGIIRTYSTRHGNGPFVSEKNLPFTDRYNVTNKWQGGLRAGTFDLVVAKYALKVNPVDALVVTHTDEVHNELCESYSFGDETIRHLEIPHTLSDQQLLTDLLFRCTPNNVEFRGRFIDEIRDRLSLPVLIESFGERSCDKRFIS